MLARTVSRVQHPAILAWPIAVRSTRAMLTGNTSRARHGSGLEYSSYAIPMARPGAPHGPAPVRV